MRTFVFLFVTEGASDLGLAPHLERLCVEAGAPETRAEVPRLDRLPRPPGHSVEQQVRRALEISPMVDAVFAHRDADATNGEARRQEIADSIGRLSGELRVAHHVPVVPVQELEAWLLLDEATIRRVAGKPRGTGRLDLPAPSRVETVAQPKERLQEALLAASGLRGHRREKFAKAFGKQRARLLEMVDVDGPLREVPAWARLREDIGRAVGAWLGEAG